MAKSPALYCRSQHPTGNGTLRAPLRRENPCVTGEEILRDLAEERQRQIAMNSAEHQQSARMEALHYLRGAFMALARTNAFENGPSLDFLQEVLAPITQPLVDEGLIVTARIETTHSVEFIRNEDSDR